MPRTSPLASFLFKGGYLRGQFAAPVPRKSSSTGFNDERSAALGSTRGFPSAAWVEQARPPAASEAAPLEVVAKKSRRFWLSALSSVIRNVLPNGCFFSRSFEWAVVISIEERVDRTAKKLHGMAHWRLPLSIPRICRSGFIQRSCVFLRQGADDLPEFGERVFVLLGLAIDQVVFFERVFLQIMQTLDLL